jgi:hypothetical protein
VSSSLTDRRRPFKIEACSIGPSSLIVCFTSRAPDAVGQSPCSGASRERRVRWLRPATISPATA